MHREGQGAWYTAAVAGAGQGLRSSAALHRCQLIHCNARGTASVGLSNRTRLPSANHVHPRRCAALSIQQPLREAMQLSWSHSAHSGGAFVLHFVHFATSTSQMNVAHVAEAGRASSRRSLRAEGSPPLSFQQQTLRHTAETILNGEPSASHTSRGQILCH